MSTSSTIKDNITVLFFSAVQEQKLLDDTAKKERDAIAEALLLHHQQQQQQTKDDNDPFHSILGESDEDDDDDDSNRNDDDDSDSDSSNDNNSKDKVDNGFETNRNIDDVASSVVDEDDEQETPPEGEDKNGEDDDDNVKLLSRDELITRLRTIAQQYNCTPQERYDYRIQYGMVGFPNVGKSSVINVLVGNSKYIHNTVRVGVASQPGKTKHFQTLLLSDHTDIMLCDCPGLVFPSFVSNTADLIAAGVYPISQMRDYYSVIQLICSRIPRHILNAHYGIQLPIPSKQDIQDRVGYSDSNTASHSSGTAASISTAADRVPNPTVDELLTTYCISRGLLASFSGVPDYQRAARIIVKDYADGKLLYCHPPPTLLLDNDDNDQNGTADTDHSKWVIKWFPVNQEFQETFMILKTIVFCTHV